jgi:hypothetical protein
MPNISAVPGEPNVSKLLALRQASQNTLVQPSQTSTPQTGGTDSLSISSSALQALQGLGLDPSQIQASQTDPTYKPHRHHHHRGGAAQLPQETPTQTVPLNKTTEAVAQIPKETPIESGAVAKGF